MSWLVGWYAVVGRTPETGAAEGEQGEVVVVMGTRNALAAPTMFI